jgi:hypothetical protein
MCSGVSIPGNRLPLSIGKVLDQVELVHAGVVLVEVSPVSVTVASDAGSLPPPHAMAAAKIPTHIRCL